MLGAVRSLWTATEQAESEEQSALQRQIIQTVHRLQGRVEKLLREAAPQDEVGTLFASLNGQAHQEPPSTPRFTEPVLRLYDKDFADHLLLHLPQAAGFNTVEEFRDHLAARLKFNSAATRGRAASRIVNRYFPNDVLHPDLVRFAAAAKGKPALGEALFYLTCRAERILSLVAEEVIFPTLAEGGVARSRISDCVRGQFPSSKSVKDIAAAVVRSYERFGVGRANRTRLLVSLRSGSLGAFAYLLHLEFPEPGMHPFDRLLQGPLHRWLLWDQQWMTQQLYRLRDTGLLAKVSEIDRFRQFTTKFTLADAIDPIVNLLKESPP